MYGERIRSAFDVPRFFSALKRGLVFLDKRLSYSIVELLDFVGNKRALCRLIDNTERKIFTAFGNAFAAKKIEQNDLPDQSLP
jgi:hypothetical protein